MVLSLRGCGKIVESATDGVLGLRTFDDENPVGVQAITVSLESVGIAQHDRVLVLFLHLARSIELQPKGGASVLARVEFAIIRSGIKFDTVKDHSV
ncbi:hypothetical protein D3C73_1237330 [compost metagenome]